MGAVIACCRSNHDQAQHIERQRQVAHEKDVANSNPLQLHCTSPTEFSFDVREANTVLEVLQMFAVKSGLPEGSAQWLQMMFAEAVIAHHNTLIEAALCDQAKFEVTGVDEFKAEVADVGEMDIWEAIGSRDLEAVRLFCRVYPEKVNVRGYDSGNGKVDGGYTPLHHAANCAQCEMATELLAAGANIWARDRYRKTPLQNALMFERDKPSYQQIVELLAAAENEREDPF